MVGHLSDFFVHHPGTLDTLGLGHASGFHQHITLTKELLGTNLVENSTAIYLARHRKGDAGWHIGLNKAGDHIHAWPLRRQH